MKEELSKEKKKRVIINITKDDSNVVAKEEKSTTETTPEQITHEDTIHVDDNSIYFIKCIFCKK